MKKRIIALGLLWCLSAVMLQAARPHKPFSVYFILQYYKFPDASSLPAENGTPRHLYFKSFLKIIVKINKKMKPTAIF